MTLRNPPIYDLTLFDTDGNPIWGTVSSGLITESSFQTPDQNKSHPRTDLLLPTNHDGAEIDFIKGRTSIGAITASVIDFRQTSTDQSTGLVTADIESAVGGRAVLRRWNETDSAWRVIVDGVTHSYTMDQEQVVVYDFHIRDGQEFARGRSLFSSNFVLWGKDGESGPGANYLEIPASSAFSDSVFFGKYVVPKVDPYETVAYDQLNHFKRVSGSSPTNGIHYGFAIAFSQSNFKSLRLPDTGNPTQADDGLYYYNDFRIEWRAQGTTNDWTVLSGMPRAVGDNAVKDGSGILEEQGEGGDEDIAGPPRAMLYFGSKTESDIPSDGQAIEYRVYAEHITEDTPFFWDNGTLGDLYAEILNGDHSDSTPSEQVDSSELTNFRNNTPSARFFLTEPVKDGKRWVEENILQPSFAAIGFNTSGELAATFWERPDAAESVDVLDEDDILEIGEWQHGIGNAIGRVEFTYIREARQKLEFKAVGAGSGDEGVTNFWRTEDGEWRSDQPPGWKLLETQEVTITSEDPDAVPGAKTIEISPVTIRTIANHDEFVEKTALLDDVGDALGQKALKTLFQRFKRGASTYRAVVRATDTIIDYTPGTWLKVRAEWLPDYETSERGLAEYMQIIRVSEIDPARREFLLVSGNVPDPEADTDKVSGTDCFSGGTLYKAPDGRSARYFSADDDLVNSCGTDQEVDILLIAGGSSGETDGVGGGAGQALEVTSVTIGANETIPITIGAGGSGDGVDGGDTTLWVDDNGNALDPATDTPPSARTAQGGGSCGTGCTPQEDANHVAGSSTAIVGGDCDGLNVGGGGASNTGDGGDGTIVSSSPPCESEGGAGAAETSYPTWGVTVGAGGDGSGNLGNNTSSGAAPGGGGASNNGTSVDGQDGAVVVLYAGTRQTLSAPTITSQGTTDQNQVQVCVDAADWPEITPAGYRVRVDWAWGTSEPAEDSGDWRLAGYITESGGCVTTGTAPSGQTIYTRATAEADEELPSEPGTTVNESLSQTAELIRLRLALDDNDNPVLTWAQNDFVEALRIRGKAHDEGDSTDRDLAQITDVLIDESPTTLTSITVEEGRWFTADVEAWDDSTGFYRQEVEDDTPLQWLRLGESSGTTAEDNSGNDNDGTYNGDPTLGATGLISNDDDTAVDFDGTGDYVDVGTLGTIGSDATRTFEVWIKTTESGQTAVFETVADGSNTFVSLGLNTAADGTSSAGVTAFRVRDEGNDLRGESFGANIYDGNKHHIVIAQDSHTSWRIYVDGNLQSTTVSTTGGTYDNPADWQYPLYVGAGNGRGTAQNETDATIDEWAVYDTALSATRVQAHYDAGAGNTTPAVAGNKDNTYRANVEHFRNQLATGDELDSALDNLAFDSELGLALDYELNPIRDSS